MSGPLQKEKHLEQLGFGPGPEQAEQTAPLQQQGGINGPQEIREHLQQLEKWDDEKMYAAKAIVEKIDGKYVRTNKTKVDKTRSQLLSEFGARMLEEFGNRQHILIQRVRHEVPRAEAEAAVPEEPVQELLPAEKSDKKVEEELKQTKAARKHNDYADYTSFNLNKQITTYYKERNNALKGKWRDGINDEDQRAMYAFLQGHASGLFAKNAERDAADRAFIEDYTSGELERRRPYLDQAVNEILNFRLNEELFTTEYMGAHGMELIAMNEKMKSFKIMRDDPINRDYFHQLPEEQLTMLTYAMDWYPQRLADMVPAILAVKGLQANGEYYNRGDAAAAAENAAGVLRRHFEIFPDMKRDRRNRRVNLEAARIQRQQDAILARVRAEADQKVREKREKGAYREEWEKHIRENKYFSFNFDAQYLSQAYNRMSLVQKLLTAFPDKYQANQKNVDRLYQKMFQTIETSLEYMGKQVAIKEIKEEKLREAGNNPTPEQAMELRVMETEIRAMHERWELMGKMTTLYENLISFFIWPRDLTDEEHALAVQEDLGLEVMDIEENWKAEKGYDAQMQQGYAASVEVGEVQYEKNLEEKIHGLTFEGMTQPAYDKKEPFYQYASRVIPYSYEKRKLNPEIEEIRKKEPRYQMPPKGPDDITVMDGSATRLALFLSRCDPKVYPTERLKTIMEQLSIYSRAALLQKRQEAKPDSITEDEQKELARYTPEYLKAQFFEGLREYKQIMLDRCRAAVRKYGTYLTQLHPKDLLAVAPDVMADIAELGSAFTTLTDSTKTLDIANNADDREMLMVLTYMHVAMRRLNFYFGEMGKEAIKAAAKGEEYVPPKILAEQDEKSGFLEAQRFVGTEYIREHFPDAPGLTAYEEDIYRNRILAKEYTGPRAYLRL